MPFDPPHYTVPQSATRLPSFDHVLINYDFKVSHSRTLLIVVPGFSEHIEFYDKFREDMVNHGINVFAFDQRGFGGSQHGDAGGRAIPSASDPHEYAKDLRCCLHKALELVVEHHSAPADSVFVFGHSLGAGTVMRYCTLFPEEAARQVTGCILTGIGDGMPFPLNTFWGRGLLRLAYSMKNDFVLGSIKPKDMTRNTALVHRMTACPLWHSSRKFTAQYIKVLMDDDAKFEHIPMKHPHVLMMNGSRDKFCDDHSFQVAFDKVVSDDKKKVVVEGSFHNVVHEPPDQGGDVALMEVCTWIEERRLQS